jgi:hypothetical protein
LQYKVVKLNETGICMRHTTTTPAVKRCGSLFDRSLETVYRVEAKALVWCSTARERALQVVDERSDRVLKTH